MNPSKNHAASVPVEHCCARGRARSAHADRRSLCCALPTRSPAPTGLRFFELRLCFPWFWKGGESLPARAGGGKSELHRARCCVTQACSAGIHAGGKFQGFPTESATENRQPAGASRRVMVKRCGKSAPREAQATRHGKPHRVQGQIGNRGAARSAFRESETGFGYRSLRQMILSAARRRQNSAYSPSKTIA